MGLENIDGEVYFPRRAGAKISRTSLVITLCVILGLLGSLMLTMTENYNSVQQSATAITANTPELATTNTTSLTTSTTSPTNEATPAAPKSSPMNSQSPILPFPTLLWEQIAVLQSHNRFLYTGNRYLPKIALTFDDGPNPYYTPQVLAVLQRYGVKATFFCIGRQVASYPDLVKQEYADGNLVGNHSWSHPNLALLSSDEIDSQINLTSNVIQQVIGVRPTLFRPPYGVVNARVLSKANLLGLTTIIWSDEARDWTTPGTSVIVSRILSLAGDGAIILMHDGGGDRSQTVAALPTIITTLRLRGYQFVTLQQMLKDLPKRPASTQAPIFVPTTIPSASPAASPGP